MQHLLLLHGAVGAKDQLRPLADILKDRFIVHAINFSGHGGEAFVEEIFSIPLFAGEVMNYLEENHIDTINIFGYSMGGYVALYIAKHYSAVVGKVITLATKFHWNEAVVAKEIRMLDADTILEKVPVFAVQLKERHHPNDWKIVLAKTKEMMIQLGERNCLTTDDYKSIFSPCLILLGDKDKMVSLEETLNVQKGLPNGEFRLLPDTPHPLEQVDVQLLAEILSEWIK